MAVKWHLGEERHWSLAPSPASAQRSPAAAVGLRRLERTRHALLQGQVRGEGPWMRAARAWLSPDLAALLSAQSQLPPLAGSEPPLPPSQPPPPPLQPPPPPRGADPEGLGSPPLWLGPGLAALLLTDSQPPPPAGCGS